MDVRCDRCETEYELDDAIVTDAGASVQCTTCGHTFVVRKRPSARLNVTGVTPPGGTLDTVGPDVPEWTLSTDDGKVHRFRDLNILQKWIVERKVGRTERISRAGGPWLSLGDVVELAPFFNVVDEADRARAAASPASNAPPPSAPSASTSGLDWQPSPTATAALLRAPAAAGTPGDSRRPISEDGPTVPNRRLPGSEASPSPTPISRSQIPLPGVRGSEPTARSTGSIPVQGRRTPPARALNGLAAGPQPSSTLAPVIGPKEGIRLPGASPRVSGRGDSLAGPNITAETRPLESDLAVGGHGGRNAVVVMILLVAAGSGGYWWWINHKPSSAAGTAGAPANEATLASATAIADNTVPPPAAGAIPVVAAMNSDKQGNPSAGSGPGAKPSPGPGSAGAGRGAGDLAAPSSRNSRPVAAGSGSAAPRSGRAAPEVTKAAATSSYDRLVAEADRLLEHGKSAKADKLYAQALAARPDGVAALTGAAYVLLDRQRHFKAIETFRRALAVNPTFGPALFGIAESYRARGDSAQALGAYRQYLAISPGGADAPAARRQIKDLESAGSASGAAAAERPSAEGAPADQNP